MPLRRFNLIPAAVCLGFVGLALAATWPLARHIDEAVPGDLGDPLLNAWILGWDANRLRHGLRGLWDAPIFFPYRHTLAFSEHLLGIAVPIAPVIWLTDHPVLGYNVAFIVSFAFAGFGMWLLVRSLTGRNDAAILAGLVFAFAPARFAHIGHLQVLMSGWMPIALWALHTYFERGSRRALALFVVAFLFQSLSNGYYIYFLALPVAIVALHELVTGRLNRRRQIVDLGVAAAVILVALAPIALVYFDVRRAYGLVRTSGEVSAFGADVGSYLHGNEALRPLIRMWRALPHVDKPQGPEGEIFPGAIALIFAGIALWPRPRAPMLKLYALIALSAFILSLGAQPTVWGRALPIGAFYRFLFAYVPGFNGLRVPARLSVVVLLGIAVLAGFGFAAIARRWPRASVPMVVVTGALVLAEGIGGPMPLAFLKPHGRPDHAAYSWVRDHGSGAVLELPAGDLDTTLQSYRYEYQTLVHGHPIVNGATGYESAMQGFLGSSASPLVEPDHFRDVPAMLRGIGVHTVIVHPNAFPDPAVGAAVVELFRSIPDEISSEARFPGIVIFGLAEKGDGDHVREKGDGDLFRVPRSAFTLAASHVGERVDRAFDGDPGTRWFSGQAQRGDEWIDVTFDRPRDVARVRILTTVRSLSDYPRELAIDVWEAQGPPRTLYRGTIFGQLARGLARDPGVGPVEIEFQPNRATRVRLRQLGRTRRWFWSIDELSLWERPIVLSLRP